MIGTMPIELVRREARLLYVLLDAAEHDGLMKGTAGEAPWQEAKDRVLDSGDFERDAALCYEILTALGA